jgi:hypothetical protein
VALVSKLIYKNFDTTQAQAIGDTVEEIAAAGNNQGNATQISESISYVSGADGVKGVKLPSYDLSKTGIHYVINPDPLLSLIVYPASGEQINGAAANAPVTLIFEEFAVFIALKLPSSGNRWFAYNEQLI